MFALLLLLGFAPSDRHDGPLVGPPAPHSSQRAAVQWRLSSRADWRAFRERWGGRWVARWDERTAAPRFLWAPGVSVGDARALVEDVARLAGVDPGELRLERRHDRGEVLFLRYDRHWRGAEVLGDHVTVVARNGRIGGVWVQLSPVSLTQTPGPGEIVLPLPIWKGEPWKGESTGLRTTIVRRSRDGSHVVFTDRTGAEVLRYAPRHWATVTLTHDERTVGDDMVEHPAREVAVTDTSGGVDTTADDGTHALSGDLEVTLEGPGLRILNDGVAITVSGTDDMLLDCGEDLPCSATQVQHAFHLAWDWLEDRWPSHPWLEAQVPATVEIDDSACNAFYSSGTINFLVGWEDTCNNPGRIADVVYHELGHGVHHYILQTGTFAGDISEGSGDYTAATILGDPYLAPEFYPGSAYLREIETDRVYPDDIEGEVHTDGLIWGSFLWNLRERWLDEYGETTGVEMADLIFLGALEQGPTLTDVYEAVVMADDDDGDLSNGTPHACELVELLDQHGLGPGPIGVVLFDHEPLEAQASATDGYEVAFELVAVTPECGDLDEDSVQLWYTVDAPFAPGLDLPEEPDTGDTGGAGDTGGVGDTSVEEDTGLDIDPYEGWTSVALERDEDRWIGTIPRQPATRQVSYFMQASSTDGSQTVYTHAGSDSGVYRFRVGDREALWCEGFEHGADGWQHGAGTPVEPDLSGVFTDEWVYGTPGGGTFVPDGPFEGSMVATTGLDSFYGPNNVQYLQSPAFDVDDPGPMLLLSTRRWLTVEDGIYDHARLFVNDTLAWENPASQDGSRHTLDTEWTQQEVDLASLLDDEGQATVSWTLISDPGLEYGGWALDEVCVVQLADVPGHYRVSDLNASDDLGDHVAVGWTQPWMVPLSGTVLVRSLDGWPESTDDGVIVHQDSAPQPGEVIEVEDSEVVPGQVYHYALFAAGEDGDDWKLDLVEGENGDQGGIPDDAPPVDTQPPEDTGSAPDTDGPCETPEECESCEDPGPCGCSNPSGGAAGLAWLLLTPGLLVRRRRGDGNDSAR